MNEQKFLVVFHAEDGKDYFDICENLQEFLDDDTKFDKFGKFTWGGMKCNLLDLMTFLQMNVNND